MNAIPDVIALPLETARERLAPLGMDIEVDRTYPTKPAKGRGVWRVIRQGRKDGKVLLVVAEEIEGVVPSSPIT